MLITDIKLNNQSVSISDQSVLKKPPYLTRVIELDYSSSILTIEFAALDFTLSKKNLYQYKLAGFNNQFIQSGTANSATFTNLDPGTYTFIVKGSNSDGVWNDKETALTIIVFPPWYMTWWFRMILITGTSAVLYFMYSYRLRKSIELQGVRNNIAQDLHDEVGSNLSSISIFTDLAISKATDKNEAVNSLLEKINEYTRTSMEAMSDIVWMINTRNDRFENVIVRMHTLSTELLEAKNYVVHLRFDQQLNALKLSMEQRKNFYLIYKEAINNIVKYAEGNNVWIAMELIQSSVQLKIKDDGKGFDLNLHSYSNGITNMQKRAELLKGDLKIVSAPGNGTLLTLQFAQ